MKKHGHYGLTLLLSTPLIFLLPPRISIPIISMMLIVTLFPNKEIAVDTLSRRGGMHTVWFAFIIGGLFMGAITTLLTLVDIGVREILGYSPSILDPVGYSFILSIGVIIGNLSHILGDILVSGGSKPTTKPFWPVSKIPICYGIRDEQHPFVNEGLVRFAIPVFILLFILKTGHIPSYL